MAYKTLLIDDESLALQRLSRLLEGYRDQIRIVDTASDGPDALEKIKKYSPDLIFLDIQMPGLTGFEVLERLDNPPMVIFCTAYDEYALKAFDTNSIDYLLKPVEPDRLAKSIKKLKRLSQNEKETLNLRLDHLLNSLKQPQTRRIQVRIGDRIKFVDTEDIVFFQAKDKYVELHTRDDFYIISQTLNQLEEELPPADFIRIHRSAMVHLKYVDEVVRWFSGGYKVKMKDNTGTELPVSRGEKHKLGL